jgi:hypothetical protein
MHRVLKLAVVVFVGAVTDAGATCQPAKSAEQTDPISYTATWPHPSRLSIAPRALRGVVSEVSTNLGGAAAPSNSGLRMAQGGCSQQCNMLYQQCEAFRMYGNQQYQACMSVAQQNVQQCMQQCGGGGGYPGTGQNVPLCQQYPNNPACR